MILLIFCQYVTVRCQRRVWIITKADRRPVAYFLVYSLYELSFYARKELASYLICLTILFLLLWFTGAKFVISTGWFYLINKSNASQQIDSVTSALFVRGVGTISCEFHKIVKLHCGKGRKFEVSWVSQR